MVDMFPGSICDRDRIEVQGILDARHSGYEELLAVRTPERSAEILVLGRVEVSPDYRDMPYGGYGAVSGRSITGISGRRFIRFGMAECGDVRYAYTDLGIGLACLRIACPAQRAILTERGIDREKRDFRIVKAVEPYLPAVGRPPEGPVPG